MKNLMKNIFFWIIAGALIFTLLDGYSRGSVKEELTYCEFKKEVQAKKVKTIVHKGDQMTVEVERHDETKFTVILPAYVQDQELKTILSENDVKESYEAVETQSFWSQLLIGAFPLLLLLGIFFFFIPLDLNFFVD